MIKKFNLIENYLKPQIKLSSTEIFFGDLKFKEKKFGILKLKNIGKIPVHFSFIPKIDEIEISKSWCSIDPIEGFLDLNKEIEIEFTFKINSKISNSLIQKKEKLEDILVLKVENAGKIWLVDFFDILIVPKGDYFIIVSGKFIPSCFGNSIEHLCKLGNNSVLKNQIESDPQNYFPIPKELISLIEKIKSLKVFHQRSIKFF